MIQFLSRTLSFNWFSSRPYWSYLCCATALPAGVRRSHAAIAMSLAACEPMLDGSAARSCAFRTHFSQTLRVVHAHCAFLLASIRVGRPASSGGSFPATSTRLGAPCSSHTGDVSEHMPHAQQPKSCTLCKCSTCSFVRARLDLFLPLLRCSPSPRPAGIVPVHTAAGVKSLRGGSTTSSLLPVPMTGSPCSSQQADMNVKMCQDWCQHPKHCAFCKCSACTMCAYAPPGLPQVRPPTSAPKADSATRARAVQPAPFSKVQCCSGSTDCNECACRAGTCKALKPRTLRSGCLADKRLRLAAVAACARQIFVVPHTMNRPAGVQSNYIYPGAQMAIGNGLTAWQRCLWYPPTDDASTGLCVGAHPFMCLPPGPPAPMHPRLCLAPRSPLPAVLIF